MNMKYLNSIWYPDYEELLASVIIDGNNIETGYYKSETYKYDKSLSFNLGILKSEFTDSVVFEPSMMNIETDYLVVYDKRLCSSLLEWIKFPQDKIISFKNVVMNSSKDITTTTIDGMFNYKAYFHPAIFEKYSEWLIKFCKDNPTKCNEKLILDCVKMKLVLENLIDSKGFDTVLKLNSKRILLKYFNFGKYKNEEIELVAYKDPEYCSWLKAKKEEELDTVMLNEDDMYYTLKYWLKKVQE